MWHWLTQTDAGLAARIGAGILIFAALALVDWRRNGPHARRWREYLFLLLCVAAAMLYGMVNDLITSSISWEYFYYGKGLSDSLGDAPPDPLRLHLAAMGVGMKATWTAGLLIGAMLLIANNPRRNRDQLSFAILCKMLLVVFAVTVLTATIFGVAGHLGWPARFSNDFAEMLRRDEMRPYRFMTVFGIHLGGYIGALVGLIVSSAIIVFMRKNRIQQDKPGPSGPGLIYE